MFTCSGFTRSIHSVIHEKPNHPLGYLTMTPPTLQKAPFLETASPKQRATRGLAKYKLSSIYTHKQLPVIHGAAEANCLQTVCLQSRLLCERRTILPSAAHQRVRRHFVSLGAFFFFPCFSFARRAEVTGNSEVSGGSETCGRRCRT